jgi:hypothetical protein
LTTFYNFQPPAQSNFTFEPTLDGNPYTAVVPYLLFGQRFYLQLTSLNGTLIFNRALVGSPSGVSIETMTWQTGYVAVETTAPHGYSVGQTIELTIKGCSPPALNGIFDCLITGPDTFTYPLPGDPGAASALGGISYDIDLAFGYFQVSTLVYRTATAQFEVGP